MQGQCLKDSGPTNPRSSHNHLMFAKMSYVMHRWRVWYILVYRLDVNQNTSTVDDSTHLGLQQISKILWLFRLLPYLNPNGKSYGNPNPVHLPTPEAWRKWCNCDASTPLDSLKVTNPKPRCLWQPADAVEWIRSLMASLSMCTAYFMY